jgi:hypothetical protein
MLLHFNWLDCPRWAASCWRCSYESIGQKRTCCLNQFWVSSYSSRCSKLISHPRTLRLTYTASIIRGKRSRRSWFCANSVPRKRSYKRTNGVFNVFNVVLYRFILCARSKSSFFRKRPVTRGPSKTNRDPAYESSHGRTSAVDDIWRFLWNWQHCNPFLSALNGSP